MDRCRLDGRGEWIISDERITSIIPLDPPLGRDRNERRQPRRKQPTRGRTSGAERPPMSSWERIRVLRRRLVERPLRRRVLSLRRRLLRLRLLRLLLHLRLERLVERARRRREVDRCPLDGNSDSLPKDDRISLITSQSSLSRCLMHC